MKKIVLLVLFLSFCKLGFAYDYYHMHTGSLIQFDSEIISEEYMYKNHLTDIAPPICGESQIPYMLYLENHDGIYEYNWECRNYIINPYYKNDIFIGGDNGIKYFVFDDNNIKLGYILWIGIDHTINNLEKITEFYLLNINSSLDFRRENLYIVNLTDQTIIPNSLGIILPYDPNILNAKFPLTIRSELNPVIKAEIDKAGINNQGILNIDSDALSWKEKDSYIAARTNILQYTDVPFDVNILSAFVYNQDDTIFIVNDIFTVFRWKKFILLKAPVTAGFTMDNLKDKKIKIRWIKSG